MQKNSKINEINKICLIFMIGSMIGYIVEMIVALVQNWHFVSRQGLLYGPFTPVYGIGILVYYIFFKFVKTRNKGIVFISSMILGGITEYLCSYIQEKAFGTISWDYSDWIFNIAISSMAAIRQKERLDDIPAEDSMDRFLDNMYPDEYMDEVFANKKYVD